jgi:hypothetical protein
LKGQGNQNIKKYKKRTFIDYSMLKPYKLKPFLTPNRPYHYSDQYELRSERTTAMGNLLVIWDHKKDVYTLEAAQLPDRTDSFNRTNVLVQVQQTLLDLLQTRNEMLLLWEIMKVAKEVRVQVRHLPTFSNIQFWAPMEAMPPLRIVYEGHREELTSFFGEAFQQFYSTDTQGGHRANLNPIEIPLLKQRTKTRKVLSRK